MGDQTFELGADIEAVIQASSVGRSVKDVLQARIERYALWQAAAAQNDPSGHFLVGRCYEEGIGVEADLTVAFVHYRAASEEGDPLGQFALARMLDLGRGVPADEPRARELYLRSAQAGLSLAQVNLALMLQQGRGGPEDHPQALGWMRAAAAAENHVGQCNLGVTLEAGNGVEPDLDEARRWYLLAAEAGYGPACFCLGLLHHDGRGVEREPEAARRWFERGAHLGDQASQFMFGAALLDGVGGPEDKEAGAQWVRRGAIQGDVDATCRYGLCLMLGEGVEAQPDEGVRWLRRAARSEQVDALYALGVAYARGEGVEKDMQGAISWFTAAHKQGHPQAAAALEAAKAAISPKNPLELTRALVRTLQSPEMPSQRWQLDAARVMDAASKAEAPTRTEMMALLLDALSLADPARAHFAALLCGALVEQGADPEPAGEPMRARFQSSVEQIAPAIRLMEALTPIDDPALHEAQVERRVEALREIHPETASVWDALDSLCRAVVTVGSGCRAMVESMRSEAPLMAALEAAAPFHKGLKDVRCLLRAPVEAPLRVVWGPRVFEMTMSGVADLFQLHVLLADALPELAEGGVSPTAVAMARGEGPQRSKELVEGVFDLYAWPALPLCSSGSAVPHGLWLAHERSPADVPTFEGVPTLILAPVTLMRAWHSVRYFERLPANVEGARALPEEEAAALLERMILAASPRH